PSLTTQASPNAVLGGSIFDTATLTGGANVEQGNITFTIFGPGGVADCNATALNTSTAFVDGDGSYNSPPFVPSQPGTYEFLASYSGDPLNAPVTTHCGDPGESVVVGQVGTGLTTQASAGIALGATVSDTATLSGATNPTGTITFSLYGPDDVECASTPVFTAMVPVGGNGDYSSGSFTPQAPGTYQFVARYSGDTDNSPSSSNCADPAESVGVSPAHPAITTRASGPVFLGGNISDTAILTGGFNPSGTITFDVYGPSDPTCNADTPTFSSTANVDGDGTYSSGPFTPTEAGTYNFVAIYNGDADNNFVGSSCGAANEMIVVTATTTTTTTSTTTTSTTTTTVPSSTTTTSSTTTVPTSTSTTSTSTTSTTVPRSTTTSTTVRSTTTTSTVPASTTTSSTSTVPPTTAPPTTAPPTTAPPPTAPPTTRPVTRTTVRTAPTTTPTTPTTVPTTTTSPSTTTSTTTTTTTTLPPTTSPTVPGLGLDRISTPPGGPAVARGQGCVPGSFVTLTVASMTVGMTVAGADGTFTANLHLAVPVGHYTVVAHCGVTLTGAITVVQSSQASPPASTGALLLVLLLVILGLIGTQFGRG
ncbi:MAG: hypothetical protein ACRDZ8_10225, partial [Acidimicrobiales bacterium]